MIPLLSLRKRNDQTATIILLGKINRKSLPESFFSTKHNFLLNTKKENISRKSHTALKYLESTLSINWIKI